MRFLTVSPYSRGHGAYERHRRIARDLIGAGHEVVWLAPGMDSPGGEIFLPIDGRIWPTPLGWVATVRQAIARHRDRLGRIDGVFTWSEYDALGLLAHPATRVLPHVFFQGGDTVECEAFIARHGAHWKRRLKSRLMGMYYPWLQRFLVPRLGRIVVQAPFLAELLRARCPDAAPMTLLPNDCRFDWSLEDNPPDIAPRLAAMKEQGMLIGLIAQAFYAAKGWDLFIEAMALLKDEPGIQAALIGYGDEAYLIEAAIGAHGLQDKVHFLGRVGAAHRLMPLFDLVVAPTRFLDACPNVVMEAMGAERMILASDIPGHRAQLAHAELMVPNGDARALAAAIVRLRDDDAARARNRALVRDRKAALDFDWDAEVVAIITAHAQGGVHQSAMSRCFEQGHCAR